MLLSFLLEDGNTDNTLVHVFSSLCTYRALVYVSVVTILRLHVTLKKNYLLENISLSFPVEAAKSEVEPFNDSTHISLQEENQSSVTHCHADASTISEEGLFSQKSFLIAGFSDETESNIVSIIRENAGKIISLQSRNVADYAVVPLLGCEVEATVGEVVTNMWLVRKPWSS